MAAELRSPHQRRSDHLSILTRRQPPPQTPGRFAKTFTDPSACAVGTFDPAFDSDADTEGPASGSSVWRHDFSRVISNSSAASASLSLDHPDRAAAIAAAASNSFDAIVAKRTQRQSRELVDSPTVSPLASMTRLSDPIEDSPSPIEPIFGDGPEGDVFTRDRASSFYGKEHTDDDSSDLVGPLSRAQLRQVLDEDYHLFYTPSRSAARAEEAEDSPKPDSPVLEESSPERARSAPVPESEAFEVAVISQRSVEDGMALSSRASTDLSRKVRSFKMFAENETLTVSIVSDDSDHSSSEDGYGLTRPEINELLQTTLSQRPRLSSGAVPLFVEEIGHLPRAAIVDGKVQRVRVADKIHGSSMRFADDGRLWFCSLSAFRSCLGGNEDRDTSSKRKVGKRSKMSRSRGVSQSYTGGQRSSVHTSEGE